MSITVTTQKQFDALPDSFPEFTYIEIKSDPSIDIEVNRKWNDASVWARDKSSVEARGNSRVWAHDKSTVVARDNSSVLAWDKSSVRAYGNSSVVAYDNSTVEVRGNSTVLAWDKSSVVAYGNSTVEALGKSSVKYAGCLADFSSWFLLNKDDVGTVEAMKRQFADQPEYMQKINMILLFS